MKIRLIMSALLLGGLMSTTAAAQYIPFSTDFTSTATAYPTADTLFIGDSWLFFATQPAGPYFGDAPNGPQISAMAGFGGNDYINVYADYNNTALPNNTLTASVFQEQSFSGANAALAETWTFSFDWKHADSAAPSGSTTTGEFIRVFDNSPTPNLLKEETFDTTTINTSFPGFDPASISLTFDPLWINGGKVQFGFTNTAGGWGGGAPDGSGVYYDNVNFTDVVPTSSLSTFCSDFEDLVPGPEFSPIGDGWQFFHTAPGGPFFGFAPQGPQVSNLADADGDPGRSVGQTNGSGDPLDPTGGGNKYLNIYQQYGNLGGFRTNDPNFDFANSVFQEQTFTADDAANAQTYTFSFDYAGGESPFGVANDPNSTAAAFIRVFDFANNLLLESTFDTSAATALVFAHGKVSLTFDPLWVNGGKVQFGFTNTASLFEPTGAYYDNVCFAVLGDANNDGVLNNFDIGDFVLALTSPAAYAAANPGVDPDGVLDMDCNGVFDNFDITPFVTALTGP